MADGREPDAKDPAASRGVEQPQKQDPAGRPSEEGGTEPTAAETFDEEGAGIAAKE